MIGSLEKLDLSNIDLISLMSEFFKLEANQTFGKVWTFEIAGRRLTDEWWMTPKLWCISNLMTPEPVVDILGIEIDPETDLANVSLQLKYSQKQFLLASLNLYNQSVRHMQFCRQF